MEKDFNHILHLGDLAFTASLLTMAARKTGRKWKVLQLVEAEQHKSQLLTQSHKAIRGITWETKLALLKLAYRKVHLHNATALPYVQWALGKEYALHLHGSEIRSQQYDSRYRDKIHNAVDNASSIFYSTPDLRAHIADRRPDARLVPVPVNSAHSSIGVVPTWLAEKPYVFFTSRWDDSKGGKKQVTLAVEMRKAFPKEIMLLGLEWGKYATAAQEAGVQLVAKQSYANYLALIKNAQLCVGQGSGVMGASELDALSLDIPLLMKLNPSWYDGSHPALINPPVLGGTAAFTLSAKEIAEMTNAYLAPYFSTYRKYYTSEITPLRLVENSPNRSAWVEKYHSPAAAFQEVLAGYRASDFR